jgi:meiotic recombination protein REC8, fungi type
MKGKAKLLLVENPRADIHTLNENHEHIFSASFDASLNGSGAFHPISSQFDEGFGFDDNFFGGLDEMDVGGIGDELARELGDGWGASPTKNQNE